MINNATSYCNYCKTRRGRG